jgi:carboxyl-terminal processing protease
VRNIRGEKGTEVILTVVNAGSQLSEYREISVIRDVIHIESVTTEALDDDIMLISISNFNEDTRSLFAQAVAELVSKESVSGIILDVRNNPGGFLDTAVKVSGYWTGDKIVVLEKFSSGLKNEYQAGLSPTLSAYPTVVLINEGSASASEIVAGALSDYGLAILIGETTFGKGTVQTLESLPDGSFVKFTVAEWLTPLGNSIEEVGIEPDIIIEQTFEDFQADRDPQLERAIEFLTNQ